MLMHLDTGLLLKSYDPDFYPPPPRPPYPNGLAEWTQDPAQAMHFADFGAAWRTIGLTSTTFPVRPDGLPNRPLSALDLVFVPVE